MSQLRLSQTRPTQAGTVLAINHPVPDFGGTFISDTAEHTAAAPLRWAQITCLTDGVIDVDKNNWNGNAHTAVTMKAGTTIYGLFPRAKAASGTFIAYYSTNQ